MNVEVFFSNGSFPKQLFKFYHGALSSQQKGGSEKAEDGMQPSCRSDAYTGVKQVSRGLSSPLREDGWSLPLCGFVGKHGGVSLSQSSLPESEVL